ncbi:hypothetical protein GEMRC1_006016 [Eukaryota sp. GEM-RC1]
MLLVLDPDFHAARMVAVGIIAAFFITKDEQRYTFDLFLSIDQPRRSLPSYVAQSIGAIPNLDMNLPCLSNTIYQILTSQGKQIQDLASLIPEALYVELAHLLTSLITNAPNDSSAESYTRFASIPPPTHFPPFQPSARLAAETRNAVTKGEDISDIEAAQRQLARGRKAWSAEEDRTVLQYIARDGPDAAFKKLVSVLGRKEEVIRSHWNRVLNPSIKKGHWSEHEDRLLLERIRVCGTDNWKEIAKVFLVEPTVNVVIDMNVSSNLP